MSCTDHQPGDVAQAVRVSLSGCLSRAPSLIKNDDPRNETSRGSLGVFESPDVVYFFAAFLALAASLASARAALTVAA